MNKLPIEVLSEIFSYLPTDLLSLRQVSPHCKNIVDNPSNGMIYSIFQKLKLKFTGVFPIKEYIIICMKFPKLLEKGIEFFTCHDIVVENPYIVNSHHMGRPFPKLLSLSEDILIRSVAMGYFGIFQLVLANCNNFDIYVCDNFIMHEIVRNDKFEMFICLMNAHFGNMAKITQYNVITHIYAEMPRICLMSAIEHGNLRITKYLVEKGVRSKYAMTIARVRNRESIIKLLDTYEIIDENPHIVVTERTIQDGIVAWVFNQADIIYQNTGMSGLAFLILVYACIYIHAYNVIRGMLFG